MTRNQVKRAVGYVRVSTDDQASSGLGMAAQVKVIREECARRGWTLKMVRDEGVSSRVAPVKREGFRSALAMMGKKGDGGADAIVVAKLDRLTRSVGDFVDLVRAAEKGGYALVILDPDVDMSTTTGRAFAQMMAVFAEMERGMISDRTKAALAQARARGQVLGAPIRVSDSATAHILRCREDGMSMRAIAGSLNRSGLAAPDGGVWAHSTVQRVLGRIAQVAS